MSQTPADLGLRLLVTGARGFVGARVMAAVKAHHPAWSLNAPGFSEATDQARGDPSLDVTNAEDVADWIRSGRPDVVLHLAAVAAVTASVNDPRLAWRVNLGGTLNVVLALQAHAPDAHLVFVSSAEVYGASLRRPDATDETALLQPVNPYAASKAAADILVRQAAAVGLPATVLRPFNHTGAGQADAFVVPSFAGQIARIEAGLEPPVLFVGSLDDERDFLDVEDVVAAYLRVIDARSRLKSGEVFNVASGTPVRIGDILDKLLSRARLAIRVEVDPGRLRQAPIPRVVGDAARLREMLGWRPTVPLERTLDDMLESRRRLLAPSASVDAQA